jgi:hypothetical protein
MKYKHKFSHRRPKRREDVEVVGLDGVITFSITVKEESRG